MQNLWPELNNEQSSPDSAGQVQESHRRRRLTEQLLLSSLRDWLLHDYVVPYCRALSASRIYRRCYWIDALGNIETRSNAKDTNQSREVERSGEGHVLDKSALYCGHPAIPSILQPIVSLADVLAQEGKTIALHGIVLEAGSSKRKETTPSINRAPTINRGATAEGEQSGNNHVTASAKAANVLPQESGIVRASWLAIAPAMLDLIGQSPAVFLLNPFGHTLFTYDDLAPLYQRTAPTELCLFISHKQVMTHLTAAKGSAAHLAPARGGPTINQGPTLTALLRSDRWKSHDKSGYLSPGQGSYIDGEAMERAIDGVIDLLIASMQRHFLSVQRIALPVQIRPAVVETAPYTLIFATRRQDSLANMNDAVCLYRRRLHEQSRRGVLAEEWFATQQQERFAEEMQQLYRRVLQQGHAQRIRRWPDLRQQLLNADFGHYSVHEYDEVVQQLLASGDVRCEWRRRSPTEAGAEMGSEERPIPGNEDVLLWK